MTINGTTITWKTIAVTVSAVLYALVVWLVGSTLAEVKEIRKDLNKVHEKNSVQDQRLYTLESWYFPPPPKQSRPGRIPPAGPGN